MNKIELKLERTKLNVFKAVVRKLSYQKLFLALLLLGVLYKASFLLSFPKKIQASEPMLLSLEESIEQIMGTVEKYQEKAQSINKVSIPPLLPSPTPIVKVQLQPTPTTSYNENIRQSFCLRVPVLLYHHIEPIPLAQKEGHAQLTVDPAIFERQMKYLVDHGYQTISAEKLATALVNHAELPKSVVVTIDDGYIDTYTYAFPIAKKYNITLNIMIPTGLIGNTGYLTWDNLHELNNSGMVNLYDHTWSHFSLPGGDLKKKEMEIMTGKQQLEEKLGKPQTIFTYPYGSYDGKTIEILKKNGFIAAFTTKHSFQQCDTYIYTLHRNHVGNAPLSSYGL